MASSKTLLLALTCLFAAAPILWMSCQDHDAITRNDNAAITSQTPDSLDVPYWDIQPELPLPDWAANETWAQVFQRIQSMPRMMRHRLRLHLLPGEDFFRDVPADTPDRMTFIANLYRMSLWLRGVERFGEPSGDLLPYATYNAATGKRELLFSRVDGHGPDYGFTFANHALDAPPGQWEERIYPWRQNGTYNGTIWGWSTPIEGNCTVRANGWVHVPNWLGAGYDICDMSIYWGTTMGPAELQNYYTRLEY